MKINLDDPNLTAFALGELSGAEHAAMEEAVSSSAEAQAFVAETQQFARLLEVGVRRPTASSRRNVRQTSSGWRSNGASGPDPMGLAGGGPGDLRRDRRGGCFDDSAGGGTLAGKTAGRAPMHKRKSPAPWKRSRSRRYDGDAQRRRRARRCGICAKNRRAAAAERCRWNSRGRKMQASRAETSQTPRCPMHGRCHSAARYHIVP